VRSANPVCKYDPKCHNLTPEHAREFFHKVPPHPRPNKGGKIHTTTAAIASSMKDCIASTAAAADVIKELKEEKAEILHELAEVKEGTPVTPLEAKSVAAHVKHEQKVYDKTHKLMGDDFSVPELVTVGDELIVTPVQAVDWYTAYLQESVGLACDGLVSSIKKRVEVCSEDLQLLQPTVDGMISVVKDECSRVFDAFVISVAHAANSAAEDLVQDVNKISRATKGSYRYPALFDRLGVDSHMFPLEPMERVVDYSAQLQDPEQWTDEFGYLPRPTVYTMRPIKAPTWLRLANLINDGMILVGNAAYTFLRIFILRFYKTWIRGQRDSADRRELLGFLLCQYYRSWPRAAAAADISLMLIKFPFLFVREVIEAYECSIQTKEMNLVFVVESLETLTTDQRTPGNRQYAGNQVSTNMVGHYAYKSTLFYRSAENEHRYLSYPHLWVNPALSKPTFTSRCFSTMAVSLNVLQCCNLTTTLYSDKDQNAFKQIVVRQINAENRIDPQFFTTLLAGDDSISNAMDLVHMFMKKTLEKRSLVEHREPVPLK
jgi:hypothetical protein